MIRLTGGVSDRGEDILAFKKSVVAQDLFERSPGGNESENVRDAHALAADTRLAAALAGFDGDSRQE